MLKDNVKLHGGRLKEDKGFIDIVYSWMLQVFPSRSREANGGGLLREGWNKCAI